MKHILTVVSGAPSGALNMAMTLVAFLERSYQSTVILRKYNKANINKAIVVKDRYAMDYIFNLCRQLNVIKTDIIIVHGYSTHLWTKIAAGIKGIPVIHVEHNTEKYTPFRRWLLQKLDKYTDRYICVSQGVANHLLKQGIDNSKVQVIYNGIDVEQFNVRQQSRMQYTVGMTARFSKQKDQLTLIKAVEYLTSEKKIPVCLILQGDGKTKSFCQQYVKQRQLANITFETGKFLDLAPRLDLFVLATHYEGLPLVLCEAMAAKIPIIASKVAGVDEIIEDGKTGYLVPESNYQKLAEKIEEMYIMKQKKDKHYENIIIEAYHRVETLFNLNNMCNQYKWEIDNQFIQEQ